MTQSPTLKNPSQLVDRRSKDSLRTNLKNLSYNKIYEQALDLFLKGKYGVNFHMIAIRCMPMDDVKSLYVLNYLYYLNGVFIKTCIDNMKAALRKELFYYINIELEQDHSYEQIHEFEVFDSIPFDGIKYSICKMLYEGYGMKDIVSILKITKNIYTYQLGKIVDYFIDNDHCGRSTFLIELIRIRYEVKFGDKKSAT